MNQQAELWTIKSALDWTEAYLGRKGDENPRLSAQWLLSIATGLSRIELYTSYDKPLDPNERITLRESIQRRVAGEPLQYIAGETGFRHLNIKVREGVLIPRPETELLVEEALSYTRQVSENRNSDQLLVLDLCTGSGCIACSIASENPDVSVLASDIAKEAVELARENISLLGLDERVTVFEGDLGEAIPEENLGKLQLIVSNPPYIPTHILEQIPREVSDFEPRLALDGGSDGLALYRRIVEWAQKALTPEGALMLELYEGHLEQAAHIAREAGFSSTEILEDLNQRPRILVAML
ncbi:MAG: peptide chain release factor N(5)-glutamine methyltransferase [Raoultibacter sp.]|jgi:release factor glutamine methyltransferase